ncbi:hypothetical protein C8046_05655 [Serinibacter arcticus]|uniref:Uncharacterized protein n=1 Tax=Serinibacter arcticus TaxID=1655435 RepID=A0A2U1ZTB0_9MICO|nr:hypothetical protein [Serinibacter arcticus]PWD50225.1 hypothetical protein C8046_05655 [Serinibacter arcticus]
MASVLVTALVRVIAGLAWAGMPAGYDVPPFEGALPAAASLAVLGTTAFLSGLAVNLVYRRLGGWAGTLALPFVLAPSLVAHWGLLDDVEAGSGFGATAWGWWVALPCIAVAALITHLLLRRLPID